MEFILLWWDELDDWTGTCRHLAMSAVSEVAEVTSPLVAAASSIAVWLLMPHVWVTAAVVADKVAL